METGNEFLQHTFLGNTVEDFLWAGGILLAGLIFKKIFSVLVTKIAYLFFKKYSKGVKVEVFLSLLTRPVSVFIMLIILFLAFDRLEFPIEWNMATEEKFGVRMVLFKAFQASMILSFTWIMLRFVDYFGLVFLHRARLTESRVDDMLIPFFKGGIKIILATFGFFVMLGSVFQVNIVTLIGGLGIGGLAVALAAKETLENLLGSVLIFMDKPFLIGDQVKVGDIEGVVDSIGLRSTRIRTFERTVVSVPNKKMMDAELENQTRREHRRARFIISLTYDTPADVIKTISSEITATLLNHDMVERETVWVHLKEFSPGSLDIQIHYFVHTAELEKFLDVREEINYRIIQIVKSNNGKFALPSRVLYVQQDEPRAASFPAIAPAAKE